MDQEKQLSNMIRQAIEQTNATIDKYSQYIQGMDDDEIKKTITKMVEKKRSNLDILKQISASDLKSLDIPEQVNASIVVGQKQIKEDATQMMQTLMGLSNNNTYSVKPVVGKQPQAKQSKNKHSKVKLPENIKDIGDHTKQRLVFDFKI